MPKLKPGSYFSGDVINGPDVNAREMYFILAGTVDEVDHEKLPTDESFFMRSSRRSFNRDGEQAAGKYTKGPRFREGTYFNEVSRVP